MRLNPEAATRLQELKRERKQLEERIKDTIRNGQDRIDYAAEAKSILSKAVWASLKVDENNNPEGFRAELAHEVEAIAELLRHSGSGFVHFDSLECVANHESRGYIKLPAQWELRAGFPRGLPSVLAGYPGAGKTRTACSIAADILFSGYSVLYFTYEMERAEIVAFVGSCLSRIYGTATSPAGFKTYMAESQGAAAKIAHLIGPKLAVVDAGGYGTDKIKADYVSAYEALHGPPDLVVIDYLGRIRHQAERGEIPVGASMRQVTEYAKRTKSAWLVVSQINRAGGANIEQAPGLTELKGSGAIEEDAALVITLGRPPGLRRSFAVRKYRYEMESAEDILVIDKTTGHVLGREGTLAKKQAEADAGHNQTTF